MSLDYSSGGREQDNGLLAWGVYRFIGFRVSGHPKLFLQHFASVVLSMQDSRGQKSPNDLLHAHIALPLARAIHPGTSHHHVHTLEI